MHIIGIDPGTCGGLAFMHSGGCVIETAKMPATAADLLDLLSTWSACSDDLQPTVYLESVHATPQQGVSSAFKFGKVCGLIEGVIAALALRYELITPMRWQKELGCLAKGRTLAGGDTEKKNANKAAAQRLFPAVKITHAIADALLIAEYGRRCEASRKQ